MKTFFALLCLIFSFQACSQDPNTNTSQTTEPPLTFASEDYPGFHADSIRNLVNLIGSTPPRDFRGLVVIQNNEVVIEEYFHTFWRTSLVDIRSAGKSITALLLGVAIQQGLIDDLNQSVYALFPSDKYPYVAQHYKDITLQHLLDMSSGLDADSDNGQSVGNAGNWIGLDDWKEYLLTVPKASAPGAGFVYADIHAVLIGAIIEEKSGMSLKDFANKYVFEPLGITQFYWFTNAANQTGAAGNLYLSTLDFAKLGLLIVSEGKWGNQQIADADYIDALSNSAFNISDYFPLSDTYGMLWYKAERTFAEREFNYMFASGNGGNHLVVIPELEMVIALTSTAYGPGPGQRRSYNVSAKVLSALK